MSATFIDVRDFPDRDRHPRALVTGVALSIALHAGIAMWMTYTAWMEPEKPPPEFVIDVVELPKPKPPLPQAAAPPPPPLLRPQLTEAPIAEKSIAPPHEAPKDESPQEKAAPAAQKKAPTVTAPPLPVTSRLADARPVLKRERAREVAPDLSETSGGKVTEVASQSVQDFILSQIARVWIIDLHSPRFRGLEITWRFILLPDGTLAPPFGKDDPWDLQRMVNPETYQIMQQPTEVGQTFRTAVTTFLQALRQAQPFRVPPDDRTYKDRVLPLHFRAGDLVQSPGEAGR